MYVPVVVRNGVGGVMVSIVAFQAVDPGSIPGQRIPFCIFSVVYIFSLFYSPFFLQIIGEGNDAKVQLLKKAERTEENQELKIEELLFSLPSHRTTLDRFLHSYESYYQRKLPNYGVHGKLISYLEEMKDTIMVRLLYNRIDLQL